MSTPKIPERPMEYPYTLVSRITAFPWKMHMTHANWRWKYAAVGYVVTIPFFIWLHRALNSPANQEKYRQVELKNAREHEEHLKHLL